MKIFIGILIVAITTVSLAQHKRQDWWQNGNFYQIYPRSFRDSNGDGIGDINGITQKLSYFRDIGMDGVWLSPIFESPMADFGYDISDYFAIQSEYGTSEDLERLIKRAHKLGLYVILDFVPNHTSDEHEWFLRSVNGDPDYRDFYVWHDGVYNSTTGKHDPPSNWVSVFRHSAWEWNDKRQQYYLHQFAVKQADLNFRNPAVLYAMDDVLRYWLSKGIDGFRVDAINYFYEVEIDQRTGTYPDEPVIENIDDCPDPADWCHLQHIYTRDNPDNFQIIYHWRKLVDDWARMYKTSSKILMTESFTTLQDLMITYGDGKRNGSHIPFNFIMLQGLSNQSTAEDFQNYTNMWLKSMPDGVFANWVMGNHDNNRIAERFGIQRVDLMNIFLQTLPGIAVTYYGEEYGQENVYVSWEDTVDIQACTADPKTFSKVSRDPVRTPFRWDSSKNAGFSKADKTWLPIGPGYRDNNVLAQLQASNSHLKIFKRLTALRKKERAFDDGNYEAKVVKNVLIYQRKAESGDPFLIILNVGNMDKVLRLYEIFSVSGYKGKVEVTSLASNLKTGSSVDLYNDFVAKAYVGYVVRLRHA